jgi:ABC-type spermidine/putrescine transport system permease subunit II
LIWNSLGQVGTLTPLWAGNLFGSAFYIFLLRQFFLGLPRELFEAARVDGANNWHMFSRIALPLCKPALVVTLLFEFQAAWTDLMRPLIYLRDSSTFTVPRGLKALLDQFGFGGDWHWELVVTASVITTVPMIILFFLGSGTSSRDRHHGQQGLTVGWAHGAGRLPARAASGTGEATGEGVSGVACWRSTSAAIRASSLRESPWR